MVVPNVIKLLTPHIYLANFTYCHLQLQPHQKPYFMRYCFDPDQRVCYFWLDSKVTKRSRLNRPVYSGQWFRCRLRNSLRSDSAGSGRYTFTLRLTTVRLGLS